MIAKVLLSALALLVSIGILVGTLEWMAPPHGAPVRASGSGSVQLQPCPADACLVP